MADKKSFVMYDNWAGLFCDMPDEQAGKLIKAICTYKLDGSDEATGDPVLDAIFNMIRDKLDVDAEKYADICRKRSEAGKSKREQKQASVNKSKQVLTNDIKDTHLYTDTDTDTDTVLHKCNIKDNIGKPDYTSEIKQVIDYLNESTDAKFSYDRKDTRKNITARLKEGYSLDDFKKVIDYKADKWRDDEKMREYLRPQTLFSPSHFESYLNEANRDPIKPKPKKENMFNNYDQNNYDYDELERRLIGNG